MRALVTGDRNWTSQQVIKLVLQEYKITSVVEGGARGADSWARLTARELGLPVYTFEANWDKYGKKAGVLPVAA